MSDYTRDGILTALREGVVEVTFDKINGTERTMRITLNPALLPGGEAAARHLAEEHRKEENLATVVAWEVELRAWRSFRIENLRYAQGIPDYI